MTTSGKTMGPDRRTAATPSEIVRIHASAIDPADLDARLAAALVVTRQHSHGVDPGDLVDRPLDVRADRLHRLWAEVSPRPLERGPGPRGRLAFEVKRTVRRLTSWYVEPRWAGQHEVDAETARFATDTARVLDDLQRRIADLEASNARLQQELRAARSTAARDTGSRS